MSKSKSDQPNIVVIFTDQQQADAMSCAGNADLHTPNLDRLAAEGVRHTRAYSTFPLCGPCRSSWVTGRYPHQIGAMTNGSHISDDQKENSVGNRLRRAGYDNGYGGKWHVGSQHLGDGRGETFGFEYLCGYADNHLPERAARFIQRPRDKPYLLFTSFDNPHNICEHSRDQILPWGEVPVVDPREHPNLPINHAPPAFESAILGDRRAGPAATYSQQRWREYRHVYYRLCEKVDEQIGRVLTAVDASGQRDNTVIIFMSDHGDMAGSHGMIYKSVFYEESVRVPLIIADPRQRDRHGSINRSLISTGIDLLPTLLDLAGVAKDADLPGGSMLSSLDRTHIVSESRFDKTEINARMVRSDRFKYVIHDRWGNREMLFDMDNDPGELVNLAVEKRYEPVLNQHRQLLWEWCDATGDNFAHHHTQMPTASIPGRGFTHVGPRADALP